MLLPTIVPHGSLIEMFFVLTFYTAVSTKDTAVDLREFIEEVSPELRLFLASMPLRGILLRRRHDFAQYFPKLNIF